jgi:hypothetical protein
VVVGRESTTQGKMMITTEDGMLDNDPNGTVDDEDGMWEAG